MSTDDVQSSRPSYRFSGEVPGALEILLDQSRWVAWDYRFKDGRWTKPPIDPRTGRLASVSDPRTWGTFDVALSGMERHGLAGVGLVLTDDGDYTGIDLDHCITDSGSLSPLAAEIVGYGETYAEVSPSGEGIRIFTKEAITEPVKNQELGIEIYATARFLTVTGHKLEESPDEIREAPRTLARLLAEVGAARSKSERKPNGKHHPTSGDFFGNVNAAALGRLDDWVPTLHPTAKKHATGAWRITSRELGRNLQEDLAYHPDGIRDHGEEHGLTPIDAVLKYGSASDPPDAALWLCQHMHIEPASLGWHGKANGAVPPPSGAKPRPKSVPEADPPHWDVEPWAETVSGAQLLDGICAVLRRYMILPRHATEAIALWVMHAWNIDAFDWSPLLIPVSPTKQCGKTTLLTILYWLTPYSELMSGASASSIFRAIDEHRALGRTPTFLLDECDSFIREDEDMRGMLNSGHMRHAAWVRRTESVGGGKFKSRRFPTWAPKVLATIRAIADTLMDRAVIIMLRRKAKGEKVERFRMRDTGELASLRRKCLRWSIDTKVGLADADPVMPEALSNRPADNWRPLIAVADATASDWSKRARDAALALSGISRDEDRNVELLRDIRHVFNETRAEWLGAERLVDMLVELPETPWREYRSGDKPITSRGVWKLLNPFAITSRKDRGGNRYYRSDFEEAFASYLPAEVQAVPDKVSEAAL